MTFKDWIFGRGATKLEPSQYLYKGRHLLTLFLVAVAATTLVLLFKKHKKGQKVTLHIIVGTMLSLEIISRIINLIKLNEYTFEKLFTVIVPCHFCSIVVVSLIIAFYTNWQQLLNASVVAGFLATIVFLSYPGVGLNTDIITFSQLYSIISHALGFIVAVLLVAYKKVNLHYKKIHHSLIYSLIAVLYMLLLNIVILPGSNYGYFVINELGVGSIHLYRLVILVLLLFSIAIWYVPSYIKEKVTNKKCHTQGNKTNI